MIVFFKHLAFQLLPPAACLRAAGWRLRSRHPRAQAETSGGPAWTWTSYSPHISSTSPSSMRTRSGTVTGDAFSSKEESSLRGDTAAWPRVEEARMGSHAVARLQNYKSKSPPKAPLYFLSTGGRDNEGCSFLQLRSMSTARRQCTLAHRGSLGSVSKHRSQRRSLTWMRAPQTAVLLQAAGPCPAAARCHSVRERQAGADGLSLGLCAGRDGR